MRDFEQFFESEYGGMVRALTLAFGDQPRAEEAAQDAFAAAYRRWSSVATMDRPGTWVYVVALRAERRRLVRQDRRKQDHVLGAVDDDADAVIDRVSLTMALEGLAERQRLVVVLRYLADLSTDETAKVLGCAPGTVKATLHVALGRLRVDLRDHEEVSGAN